MAIFAIRWPMSENAIIAVSTSLSQPEAEMEVIGKDVLIPQGRIVNTVGELVKLGHIAPITPIILEVGVKSHDIPVQQQVRDVNIDEIILPDAKSSTVRSGRKSELPEHIKRLADKVVNRNKEVVGVPPNFIPKAGSGNSGFSI